MRSARKFFPWFWLVILGFLPHHVAAEDLEQRWGTLLESAQYSAQREKLEASGQKFYGLYRQNHYRTAKGAVLILHDRNQHPDWPSVIHPIRAGLPAFGWSTLSIQLPVSDNTATNGAFTRQTEESAARIRAGIDFLQSKGHKALAIVGYGMGARLAVRTLGDMSQSPIKSLVLISMDNQGGAQALEPGSDLFRIEIPVLDVVGGFETKSVLAAARTRRQHRDKMRLYRSLVIAGANHEYQRQQDILVKRIRGWLSRTIEQINPEN